MASNDDVDDDDDDARELFFCCFLSAHESEKLDSAFAHHRDDVFLFGCQKRVCMCACVSGGKWVIIIGD